MIGSSPDPALTPSRPPAPLPSHTQPARWHIPVFVLALIPAQAFWLVRVATERGGFGANNTDVSLFFTTVFALFVAGVLNAGQGSAKIMTYRTGVGREAFNRLEDWLKNPRGTDVTGLRWMAGGTAFTFALAFCQSRLLWWPLHPIGYAFSTCHAMEYWWSTIALTWLIKLLMVRYGGLKTYVRARALFLGLILGDAVAACVRAFLSWLSGWHGISRY